MRSIDTPFPNPCDDVRGFHHVVPHVVAVPSHFFDCDFPLEICSWQQCFNGIQRFLSRKAVHEAFPVAVPNTGKHFTPVTPIAIQVIRAKA